MAVVLLLLKTVGVLGFLSLLIFYLRKIRLYRAAAKFPGPPALPFIGNAHVFVGSTEDILNKITELLDAYPSPLRFWLGSRLFFGVCEAEQLKIVFTSPKTIEKEDLYKFARPWLGTGLFTAPASKWRVHRKLILPTFNPRILESFVEVFAQQSEIMVRQMKVEIDGDEFDVFNYISLCTLDIICETAMGVAMKAQTEGDPTYVESAKRTFEILYTRMFKVWLHPDVIFNNTRLGKDQRECIEYLHGLTNDVIKKKKRDLANDSPIIEDTKPRKAFLDLLMELSNEGTKFTDEELREEVDTMMIAGNDTTASVNSFVMLMLANYPEVQERCYQELCTIYGDNINTDTAITHEDLHRMEYLERTIKETLRLFPVGPVLVRYVSEDLDIGDHVLPRGSSVVIGILKMHRSEKYWKEPLKFDPDRFLPEEVAKRHAYCFVPFSAGPRNCIGVRYAMMAMKTLLATVLRHYVLKKDQFVRIEDIKLKADVMLKPVEPISVKIERRRR
ncbi:cytochrome P450 4C1 [Diachasma alloeum]|uniref:cytochrome P450 4C1 n=1 Tax=Diachasma alloeum TaxID=454923 RepID=UPI0007382E56|nr:cytochrome P450 4C1 [Diachasma alloeum]